MTLLARGAIAGLLAATSIAAAEAPPPIPIDSSATAARAADLAVSAYGEASRVTLYLVDRPRYNIVTTLALLNAQTTPGAAAGRKGVTVACPFGGTVHAKFAANNSTVLRLAWNDCVMRQDADGYTTTYRGEGRLCLPAQTFTPEYAKSYHLGGELSSFTESNAEAAYPDNLFELVYDVSVVGRVPLTRFRGVGIFTGEFDYSVNGTVESRSVTVPAPGFPPFEYQTFYTADGIRAFGSTVHTEEDTVLTEHLTLRRGNFSVSFQNTNQPLTPEMSFTAYHWHVARDINGRTGTSSQWVDGRVDYRFPPFMGSCRDGVYSFRTVAPIRHANVFEGDARDQGTVVLNQSAKLTLSLTSEPTSNPPWYTPQPDDLITQAVVKQGKTELLNTSSYFIGSTLRELGYCTN